MIEREELWPKLKRDKRYREEFVAQIAKQAIPFQIGALLEQHDFTQAELATRAGLTQGVISRAADPSYGNLTINTVVRIAAGFDVAFVGLFVPFSELPKWFDRIYSETFTVPSFAIEDAQQEAAAHELLARAMLPERDKGSVTRMEDWVQKQLSGGRDDQALASHRKPPKQVQTKEMANRGNRLNTSRDGNLLRSNGTDESIPQS